MLGEIWGLGGGGGGRRQWEWGIGQWEKAHERTELVLIIERPNVAKWNVFYLSVIAITEQAGNKWKVSMHMQIKEWEKKWEDNGIKQSANLKKITSVEIMTKILERYVCFPGCL